MPEDFIGGDGGTSRAMTPARHGEASLLLVESLIHGLIECGTLTLPQAIEIVDAAAEVEDEIGLVSGARDDAVASLLDPIAASLRLDLDR